MSQMLLKHGLPPLGHRRCSPHPASVACCFGNCLLDWGVAHACESVVHAWWVGQLQCWLCAGVSFHQQQATKRFLHILALCGSGRMDPPATLMQSVWVAPWCTLHAHVCARVLCLHTCLFRLTLALGAVRVVAGCRSCVASYGTRDRLQGCFATSCCRIFKHCLSFAACLCVLHLIKFLFFIGDCVIGNLLLVFFHSYTLQGAHMHAA